LNIAESKSPEDEWMMIFNEHARIALMVEKALHQSFFKDWGLSEKDVLSTPMSPANLAYTSYLKATAYSKPFHELLGALLPCYWIYWEVGKELEKKGSKSYFYQRWIDTYSSNEYAYICRVVLNVADTLVWDSAYKLER
jgi:thiaminase/transcriptional activator TenA